MLHMCLYLQYLNIASEQYFNVDQSKRNTFFDEPNSITFHLRHLIIKLTIDTKTVNYSSLGQPNYKLSTVSNR